MGLVDLAERALRRAILLALASLCACAHLPPLIVPSDPLDAEEHRRLGSAYEAQGLKADAARQYEAATRKDPKDAEAWVALGNLSYAAGDFAAAEKDFRRALKAVPRHPGASNNLAMTLLAQGRDLDRAEELARDALSQDTPLKPYIKDTLANIQARRSSLAQKH